MDKKVERVIDMYCRINDGKPINKAEEAKRFGVNERTIQRDIWDIKVYLENTSGGSKRLVYDRSHKGYVLAENQNEHLTNSEVFAVCKILLESRAMVKTEMIPIIDKLVSCCVSHGSRKKVSALISNEKFHYLEPHHGKKFVEIMWDIGNAVYEHRLMRIKYKKLNEDDEVTRLVQPVGIMFSEFYFYLTAYICVDEKTPDIPKKPFPAIYRIDRITGYEVSDKHFHLPYADRFEEGEFRKRVMFMFGGELRMIKFLYKGISIESILDRFPTAEIIEHSKDGYLIKAEVYGDGADIWLRGQGDMVEVVENRIIRGGEKLLRKQMTRLSAKKLTD